MWVGSVTGYDSLWGDLHALVCLRYAAILSSATVAANQTRHERGGGYFIIVGSQRTRLGSFIKKGSAVIQTKSTSQDQTSTEKNILIGGNMSPFLFILRET